MKQTKKNEIIEQLNANEMMLVKGGTSSESGEVTIVIIGGKPYIVINGELRPMQA